jgi:hypothetical protein
MGEEERQPWRRLPGEGQREYSCFCIYRDLGVGRSLTLAVEQYLTQPADKSATMRVRQQRRLNAHADPKGYKRNVRKNWGLWSRYWQWVGRCKSFDEYMHDLAQTQREEASLRSAEAEIAERERQAQTRLGTYRRGRAVASALLGKVIAGLAEGQKLQQLDAVALLPHLARIASLMDLSIKGEVAELKEAARVASGGKAAEPDAVETTEDVKAKETELARVFYEEWKRIAKSEAQADDGAE